MPRKTRKISSSNIENQEKLSKAAWTALNTIITEETYHMSTKTELVLAEYKQLFSALNPELTPCVEIMKGGWYKLNDSKKMRLKTVKEHINIMSKELNADKVEQPTSEQTEQAEQTPASLTVNDLTTMYQAINLAAERGAFKVEEFVPVGLVTQKLKAMLLAIQDAQAPTEDEPESKNPSPKEDKVSKANKTTKAPAEAE